MRVQFLGEPDDKISVSSHHARALADAGDEISFDSSDEADPNPRGPDIIHVITYEQTSYSLFRKLVAARMAGIQIVRYWTGRDVLWAQHHEPTREMALALLPLSAVQLCRTPEIAAQLQELGIEAKPLPVVSTNISSAAEPQTLPASFTVLCYLPENRRAFHGGDIIDAMVERLPSVRFLILGAGGQTLADRENVECLISDTDSVRTIYRSTVFVDPRLDAGLSRLALESLCHGRHVISGYKLPHAHQARTIDEFEEAVRSLREAPEFNLAGRSFIHAEHDGQIATQALRRELEESIQPGRLNLVIEGGVRGATATWKNPQILTNRTFPIPTLEEVPADAHALRALLRDRQPEAQPVAV